MLKYTNSLFESLDKVVEYANYFGVDIVYIESNEYPVQGKNYTNTVYEAIFAQERTPGSGS